MPGGGSDLMGSIKITADTKGINKLLEKRLEQNAMRQLKKKMTRSVMLVHGTAVDEIQRGAKSGITYELYNPRRTHTSSAPGQAPATDTGFLVSSITHQVKKSGKNLVGQIVASAPYAIHLEFGTREMHKRPFMQPALEKNKEKIERIFSSGGYDLDFPLQPTVNITDTVTAIVVPHAGHGDILVP